MGIDNSKIYNKKNRSIIYFKLLVASNVIWNQIMSLKEVDHPEFQSETRHFDERCAGAGFK